MNTKIRVLLIEDNPSDARLIRELLVGAPGLSFELEVVENLVDGVERLRISNIDVVLLDLGLPESIGLDTLRRLLSHISKIPTLIIISGLADEDIAIEALHLGARDYLTKGQFDSALLLRSLRYSIERSQAD